MESLVEMSPGDAIVLEFMKISKDSLIAIVDLVGDGVVVLVADAFLYDKVVVLVVESASHHPLDMVLQKLLQVGVAIHQLLKLLTFNQLLRISLLPLRLHLPPDVLEELADCRTT